MLGEPLLCYRLHFTYVKRCLFWCNERRRVRRPFTALSPYTMHGINAACFGAMGVGLLCNPLLCYSPPYTAPRLNAACFGAMGVGVLGDAFLCSPRLLMPV